MKVNRKYLLIGMAIVLLSWIGNYTVFAAHQLKGPIMLKHYYDFPVSSGIPIELHYIVNRNEDVDIQFATVPGTDIMFYSYPQNYWPTYRHYLRKTIYYKLTDELIEQIKEEPLSFNQIQAFLTNGETVFLDIGEVTLFTREQSPFHYKSSGSSNQNNGYSLLAADQEIEITRLDIPFSEDLHSVLSIKLNENQVELQRFLTRNYYQENNFPEGIELTPNHFPLLKKKGQFVSFHYQWTFDDDDSKKYHYYSLTAKLKGLDKAGNEFTDPITLSYRPYFYDKDIRAIVREAKK